MKMLFTKLKLDDLVLKNRIIMPPMDTFSAKDGLINDFHLLHYTSRAYAGVGLIIVESTAVCKDARISDGCLGLWDDTQIQGHKLLVKALHENGAKVALQLNHSGRKNGCLNTKSKGPSPIPFSPQYENLQVLSIDEIKDIEKAFINAASRAKQAGYDAVQIHAAHGYLLNSFLCKLSNSRQDEYGGCFKNRCKLLLDIVRGVKKLGLNTMVRISATQWEEGGWDCDDSIKLGELLEKEGISLLDVSAGGNLANPSKMPALKPLYQCKYAKKLKEKLKVPISCVGLITTGSEGEALLLGGVCDAVCYGRAMLANPNLAQAMAFELNESLFINKELKRAFYK